MAFKTNKPANAAAAPAASPVATANKYDKLTDTEVTKSGVYITPGHYLLRMDSFRHKNGFKGESRVAETTVVHTFADSPVGATRAGTQVGDVIKPTNKAEMPRLKNLIDSFGALTQEDWTREGGSAILAEATSDVQPLTGFVVEARASLRVKQGREGKALEALVPGVDTYVATSYGRRLKFSEVAAIVSPDVLAAEFPDIEAQIADESGS